MERLLIDGGEIVSGGRRFAGYVVVCGERITEVGEGGYRGNFDGKRTDASGKLLLPGVIDDQVHFREPGPTHKADIRSESRAAVAGGVTSFMEMPNTDPPTTSLAELERKFDRAGEVSPANYSFYLGATNDNMGEIRKIDPRHVCGVKLFMGSSTGDMLVDDDRSLSAIFAESPVLIAVHCEDEGIVRRNMARFRMEFGDGIEPLMHPLIRTAEACYRSSAKAVELADRYGSHLHVLHLSTERELALFDVKPLADKKITNEVCVHHLWFDRDDYAAKGNMIKWNPAIKTPGDREALRAGIVSGRVDVVATDHAPHTLEEKNRPYWDCPSGGPLVQHSLAAMLTLAGQGVLTVEQVVEKMCHAPAVRYRIKERGYIKEGYYADMAIVDPNAPWTVGKENILYKCGWSPFEGMRFTARVERTLVNGHAAYDGGSVGEGAHGKPLEFVR